MQHRNLPALLKPPGGNDMAFRGHQKETSRCLADKKKHPEKTSHSHQENMTTIWGCNRTYSLGALSILQSKMELFRLGHLEWTWWFHRIFGWSSCHQHDCDCKILNLHFPLAPYIKFCNDQFRMEELNMFPYIHGTRPLQENNNNFQVHHILDEAKWFAKIRFFPGKPGPRYLNGFSCGMLWDLGPGMSPPA